MHTHVESNVRRCSFWRCLRPTFPCVYAYICTLPTPYSPALSQKARRLHTCTHTTGMDTTYSILLEELVGFAVFVVSFTQIPVPCAGRYAFYIPLILLCANGPVTGVPLGPRLGASGPVLERELNAARLRRPALDLSMHTHVATSPVCLHPTPDFQLQN